MTEMIYDNLPYSYVQHMPDPQFVCLDDNELHGAPIANDGNLRAHIFSVYEYPCGNNMDPVQNNFNVQSQMNCQPAVNEFGQALRPFMFVQYVYPDNNIMTNQLPQEPTIQQNNQMINVQGFQPQFIQNNVELPPNISCEMPFNLTYSYVPSPKKTPVKQFNHDNFLIDANANINTESKFEDEHHCFRSRDKKTKKVKEFPCPIYGCNLIIKRKDDLARHLRTHSGEKPFHCTTCDKKFSRKDHLRSHERTHTKERPYTCPVCNRGFARSDERKRHLKIHSSTRVKKLANNGVNQVVQPHMPPMLQ